MKKGIDFFSILLMAGLLSGMAGSAVAAVPEAVEWGKYKDYDFCFSDNPSELFATVRVWEPGTTVYYPYTLRDDDHKFSAERALLEEGNPLISSTSKVKSELASIELSFQYLKDLIGNPVKGTPVISLCLNNTRNGNAAATSNQTSDPNYYLTDLSQYYIDDGKKLSTDDFYAGLIIVNLPWDYAPNYYGLSVLSENGICQGYTATVTHEMIHALGLSYSADTMTYIEPTVNGNRVYFATSVRNENLYASGLHGVYGETIVDYPNDTAKKVVAITKEVFDQGAKPSETELSENFYTVLVNEYSGIYFMPVDESDGTVNKGSETYKVLDEALIAWPDDCSMPAVPGLPVLGWEFSQNLDDYHCYALELSHIELQNCLMSHQHYRNWDLLMEAEIALLQDLGYSIDREKFYGGSLYNSDVTKTVLSDDFTSSQQYAIGYHVYGSNNRVDLGATIQPTGAGAVGIRVDGVGNDVNVNKVVNLSGSAATGVMFSYGKNHNLTVNAPITASGTDSIGLRFDFGDNVLGDGKEYRGSYIRGGVVLDTREEYGKSTPSKTGWVDFDYVSALDGPLMSRVDINNVVTGSKQAIYISKNAYVENLNLNDGAKINGDIVSEWNPTGVIFTAEEANYTNPGDTDLRLNKAILGNTDPATLMTALNFNANVDVEGNIIGYNSLDMNVAEDKVVNISGDVAVHDLHFADSKLTVAGDVYVAEGQVRGALEGNIASGNWTNCKESPHQSNTALGQLNSAALLGWRAQNNDLNKRMGELRMKNGKIGVWARMSRGENEEGSTLRNFNLYQVGYDAELGRGWIGGAAASLTRGNGHTNSDKGSAKAEDKSGAFALYATRLNRDNTFIDLIAKYGKTSYDVESYMTTGMGSYDFDTPTMSLSAEIGKRYQQGGFWLEPQAEFTYGLARSADYTTSLGVAAHQDIFKTAVGRLGVVLGRDLPEGNIYIRGSYLHDFQGNSDLVVSKDGIIRNYNNDMGGSWWEFGIGTNLKTGKYSYIYADVEKTCGGSMRTPWRWNLGARWSF